MRTLMVAPLLAMVLVPAYYIISPAPTPQPSLDQHAWWGPKETIGKRDTSISPFKIEFSEEMIEDLKNRLLRSRFTPPLEGVAFQYGFNKNELNSWRTYWAESYNFTERQKEMNKYPQFRTNVQGLDIHFVRVKPKISSGKEILPLLILHGWPGSVREFYEAIPHLTAVNSDRDFVLELIIPSLPGYGFSSAAVRPNLGVAEMAVIFKNLMTRLGYNQFYLQGGDLGSIIGKVMTTLYPKEVLGYHTNLPFVSSFRGSFWTAMFGIFPSFFDEARLVDRLHQIASLLPGELGYLHMQATKPDTLGVAIADSPIGLLAYILEKFSTGTNFQYRLLPDGGLTLKFSKDQLLDNLMMYWVPNCFTPAVRLYAETFNSRYVTENWDDIPTDVPTWALNARYEMAYQPSSILRIKHKNLLGTTVLDNGGHFIAFEMPETYANDVISAVEEFRRFRRNRQ